MTIPCPGPERLQAVSRTHSRVLSPFLANYKLQDESMPFATLACMLIAIDGDTLRCGQERIRLLGIDVPELPGHCVEGRRCAPGDPVASKAALADASRGSATIERQGRDVHGRTLARIRVNGINLSCSQIASGHAIY